MATITIVNVPDNAILVAKALERDQAAWNEIVDRYTRLVWHVVRGFHQLDEQRQADAHQTTWLRLAEQLNNIRDPERLAGWLATTARRECYRLVRTSSREIPKNEIDVAPFQASIDQHLLESERDAHLWHLFRELDESCQELLRLLLADPPLSYDEVSQLLGIARGSIGPTRRRCLDSLRTKLNRIPQGGQS
jgi:RNA polymerase sigma factor (sigma-70 family)